MLNINNKGVSLVALVITIIVLLILAGITLSLTLGDNGIISKAQQAKLKTNISQAEETIKLKITELRAENNGDISIDDISTIEGVQLTNNNTNLIYENKYIFSLNDSFNVSDGREYSENQIVKVRALRVFDNFDREDR